MYMMRLTIIDEDYKTNVIKALADAGCKSGSIVDTRRIQTDFDDMEMSNIGKIFSKTSGDFESTIFITAKNFEQINSFVSHLEKDKEIEVPIQEIIKFNVLPIVARFSKGTNGKVMHYKHDDL